MTKESAAIKLSILILQAAEALRTEAFGEMLSEKKKWKLKWRDAISLYLAQKYGWTIPHCRSMSQEDLELVLCEELNAFDFPKHIAGVADTLEDTLEKLKKISGR